MKRAMILLAISVLSMTLVTITVKAEDKATDLSRLVQKVMATDGVGDYPNGFAQAVGLDKPMPVKGVIALIGNEARKFHVIYEVDEAGSPRPFCIHLVRARKSKHDIQERYFRVNLDGQLEKVITLRNKLNEKGKAIPEGRSKFEEDIDSAEIRKLFKTEMNFWLKDWLKKQKKSG